MALKTNHAYDIPPMHARPAKRQPVNDGLVDVLRCFPDGVFRSVVHPGVETIGTYRNDVEQTAVGYAGCTRWVTTASPQWANRFVPGGSFSDVCTVFVLCVKTGTGTEQTHLFKVGNQLTACWGLEVLAGHTQARGNCWSSSFEKIATGSFTALALHDVFTVSCSRSPWDTETGELVTTFNGGLEGAAAGSRSSTPVTGFSSAIWIGARDGLTSEPPIKVAMVAVWHRKLNNAELAQLAGDPYMIFRDSSPDLTSSMRPIDDVHGCAEITHASATAEVTTEAC